MRISGSIVFLGFDVESRKVQGKYVLCDNPTQMLMIHPKDSTKHTHIDVAVDEEKGAAEPCSRNKRRHAPLEERGAKINLKRREKPRRFYPLLDTPG